jgi:ADP-heptose:LPS heptosyltransferase
LANCRYLFKGGYGEHFSAFKPFITHHTDLVENGHMIYGRLSLIEPLGCDIRNIDMQIPCDYPHYPKNPERFIVGFQMGTSLSSPGRRWSVKAYAQLAQKLIAFSERVEIVLVGVASEQELVQQFLSLMPQNDQSRVVDRVGKTTLSELIGYLEQMDLLVTPDTGTMHLGTALKTPIVAILPSEGSYGSEPIQDKEIHILMRPTKERIENSETDGSDSISPYEVFEAIVTKWAKHMA